MRARVGAQRSFFHTGFWTNASVESGDACVARAQGTHEFTPTFSSYFRCFGGRRFLWVVAVRLERFFLRSPGCMGRRRALPEWRWSARQRVAVRIGFLFLPAGPGENLALRPEQRPRDQSALPACRPHQRAASLRSRRRDLTLTSGCRVIRRAQLQRIAASAPAQAGSAQRPAQRARTAPANCYPSVESRKCVTADEGPPTYGAENRNAGKLPAFLRLRAVQPRPWITPLMTFTLSPLRQLGGVAWVNRPLLPSS